MPIRYCLVWILVAGWLGFCPGCQNYAALDPPLPLAENVQAVHEALFDCILPPQCLRDDEAMAKQAGELKCQIWVAASGNSDLLDSLRRLDQIALASGGGHFSALTAAQRDRLLWNLQCSPDADQRRLAGALRTRYVLWIYSSPLGWAIADAVADATVAADAAKRVDDLRGKISPTQLIYNPREQTVGRFGGEIDYLIVGGGPAGAVLAHELREGGHSVVLVERGPLVVPGTVDGRVMPWLFESGGWRTSVDGGVRFNNGQAVGGGSTVNIDLAFAPTLPMVSERIEQWRRQGRLGPNQFSPRQIAHTYDWVKRTLGTRRLTEAEINANNRILWDGAIKHGLHPALYDLNTFPPGVSPWAVTDKRSAVDGLILESLCDSKNPLSLLSETKAMRIIFEKAADPVGTLRATGVEIQTQEPADWPGVLHDPSRLKIPAGVTLRISARHIIVCAGTLGSAALLLNSHLNSPAVGRGVVAHPSMPLIGVFDHPIRGTEGTPSSVYVGDYALTRGFVLEAMSAPPAYVAAMVPGDGARVYEVTHQFQNLGGFGVMLIDTPSPDNRIAVNAAGEPRIEYCLTEADKGRFAYGVAEAARILFQAGAKQVIVPSTEDILGDGQTRRCGVTLTDISQADLVEKNLRFVPGRTIVTAAHLQGSLKMGADPADSVVSPEFAVWGTSNLYVVDSSVFPASVGANPMQSIYTMAKIFADGMNEKVESGE